MSWALITGSSKRIGRSIAIELATAGWDIIAHYHTSQAEAEQLADDIDELGRKIVLAELDLANEKATSNLIPALAAELGPITVLVNNAALFEPDTTDPTGTRHIAINVTAPRLLSTALHQQGNSNFIVNLLDANPSYPDFTAYNASKKQLELQTMEMAAAFAPNSRVNGIALGPVLPSPRQSAEHFAKLVDATPLQRKITPEQVATAVRFLTDNPTITGTCLYVDAGLHLQVTR